MISAKDGFVTAAFLMEGLHDAGYDKCIEAWGQGCIELVSELMSYAPHLVGLCESCGESIAYDFPGVFDYEVSSSFGNWFGNQIIETGQAPSWDEAHSVMREMVLAFFKQGATEAEQAALDKVLQSERIEEGLYVLLQSCGNPDMGQNPDEPLYGCEEGRWLRVESLEEAAKECRAFIERNGLGASQWAGGEIRRAQQDDSFIEAKVRYSGRIELPLHPDIQPIVDL